jgi:hypothetical protein
VLASARGSARAPLRFGGEGSPDTVVPVRRCEADAQAGLGMRGAGKAAPRWRAVRELARGSAIFGAWRELLLLDFVTVGTRSLHAHKRKLAPHQLGFESLCCRTSSAPPSLLLDPPHLLELYCQTSRLRCWPSRLRRCTRSYWSAIPCSSLCCWTRSHSFAIPAAPPSSIPNTFLVLDVSMC